MRDWFTRTRYVSCISGTSSVRLGSTSSSTLSPFPMAGHSSDQIAGVEAAGSEQGAELAQGIALDLADALAAEGQALADRLQRFGRIAVEAKPAAEDGGFVGRQVVEDGQEIGPRAQQPPEGRAGIGGRVGDGVHQ